MPDGTGGGGGAKKTPGTILWNGVYISDAQVLGDASRTAKSANEAIYLGQNFYEDRDGFIVGLDGEQLTKAQARASYLTSQGWLQAGT